MSQRIGAKTGRRKKKVKSSSLSTTKTPEKTTNETSEPDGAQSTDSTLETVDNPIPVENEVFVGIPDGFFLVDAPQLNDIDGVQVKSALFSSKKWPLRMVNFPTDGKNIITGYHEPANPWRHAEDVDRDILISSYKNSCEHHCTEPLKNVIEQLENLDVHNGRGSDFSLKNECLEAPACEPLEEIFKRVQFRRIDMEGSNLDDESAETLFDMFEYYESATNINISGNCDIGYRGWLACAQMIKKTLCLEQLDARDIVLTQQHMNILKRPFQCVSHLRILKLENCGLSGRAFIILISALKVNHGLKELYLADNNFDVQDAIQLGSLLRANHYLQLLDVSNNKVRDDGVKIILDALAAQSNEEEKIEHGLRILVLWNNHLTKNSCGYFAEAIAKSKTLETLNIGQNIMTDDFLEICKDALKKNTSLIQLGIQATGLLLKGIVALADVIENNQTLQRIDLRDNNLQLTGLTFLALALKKNTTVTQIDLDDTTESKSPPLIEQYTELVSDIRQYCTRNDEPSSTEESTEDTSSPQHRSRLSSVNSRKISLTCQTLPRSPPALSSAEVTGRTTMLEPKRTTGGRLRSPAPSPIPSPVASPIPSPSRSRFVVSRVSEASLSSTNSSASSSPVTPPSSASSPTCFFPSTTGASRFRVTVVESPKLITTNSPLNNVVPPANANIPIGFNDRGNHSERIGSNDSDNVFHSETDSESRLKSESSVENDVSFDEILRSIEPESVFDQLENPITSFSSCSIIDPPEINNKPPVLINHVPINNIESEKVPDFNDRDLSLDNIEIPKKTSSLERLIGLFQRPGSLFTGTFSSTEKTEVRNPLQGSMDSMIALGDKFQQYLRQDTAKPVPLQRSASEALRTAVRIDPVKSSSVPHLPGIEMTNDQLNSRIESPEKIIDFHGSFDDTQKRNSLNGRLPEVREVEAEIDRIDLLLPDVEKSSRTAQDERNIGVPVLTLESELSVMNGPSDDECIDGIMNKEIVVDSERGVKIVCDSSSKDSINVCNFKMASVCNDECDIDNLKIVNNADNGDDEDDSADNVHNFSNPNNDNSLIDYQSNNNNSEVDANDRSNFFIGNNNQGNEDDNDNAQYQLSIEIDVKDALTSILNAIPSMADSTVCQEISVACDPNATENSIDIHSDNIDSNTNDANIVQDSLRFSSLARENSSVKLIVNDELCENVMIGVETNDNVLFELSRNVKEEDMINNVSIVYQNCTEEASSIIDEFSEPQTSRSPTNLFIEKSRNIHRNSQDSGIEETIVSISDDNIMEISKNLQPRNSFQESVDSGFDSECSSLHNKMETALDTAKEINIPEMNKEESQETKNAILRGSVIAHNGSSATVDDKHKSLMDPQRLDEMNIQINDE